MLRGSLWVLSEPMVFHSSAYFSPIANQFLIPGIQFPADIARLWPLKSSPL